MKYLITPSLLNSAAWYLSVIDEDKQEEERKKFIATLRREKFEQTRAMLYGIKFEKDVETLTQNKNIETSGDEFYREIIYEIAVIVMAGTWQLPCKKLYKNFLLYGRMDVVKGNMIYDIKTTARYDVGKFQASAQHRLYLYCTGLERCEYLIAEVYHGVEGTSAKGFCREIYTNRDIEPMVDDFINWLEYDKELRGLYYKHWGAK